MDRNPEWLETDGLGGFSSGTATGIRTRRTHALLLPAMTPPRGRVVLVNGIEAWVEHAGTTEALSSQLYTPGIVHPDGQDRIREFEGDPWPRWVFSLADGTSVEHELFVPYRCPAVVLRWWLPRASAEVKLNVRLLLSGRDAHALHRENPAFRFEPARTEDGDFRWQPYSGVPALLARVNGWYRHRPDWYRNFVYEQERARGLDCIEDLASPGVFHWDLSADEAWMVLAAEGTSLEEFLSTARAGLRGPGLRERERRRRAAFPSPLERSADAYLVARGTGKTIVAGYPWFGEWGRDTFVALRGLCLATGRLDEARQILLEWSPSVSGGMLPNRVHEAGGAPEYDSADASLWYVVAFHELVEALRREGKRASGHDLSLLRRTVDAILDGYARGTRHGIRLDADGLLAAGADGVPLTWMDARVGGRAVTPRAGKAVEIQALWLNALRVGSAWVPEREALFERGRRSFAGRFWNEKDGCLYDVVDVDHEPGRCDASFRPNQIFAVGGLPWAVLEGDRARRVVDEVERRLLTPVGLRSLAPGEPGYAPRCEGGVRERDAAYYQGTVWPWLLGPFVEAWVRVRDDRRAATREARARFLDPLAAHLREAGFQHVPEIADAEEPHVFRGCPFQAWSLGELLRLRDLVLTSPSRTSA